MTRIYKAALATKPGNPDAYEIYGSGALNSEEVIEEVTAQARYFGTIEVREVVLCEYSPLVPEPKPPEPELHPVLKLERRAEQLFVVLIGSFIGTSVGIPVTFFVRWLFGF